MSMDAWTRSTKRGNPNFSDYFNPSKKQRYSYSKERRSRETLEVGCTNAVSRLSRYPERSVNKLKREVHAPCRTLKFGPLKHRSEQENLRADRMGNFLAEKFDHAKKSACKLLGYFSLAKEPSLIHYPDENQNEHAEKLEKEVIDCEADAEKDATEGEEEEKHADEISEVTLSENLCHGSGEDSVENLGFNSGHPTDEIYDSGVEVYKMLVDSARMRSERLDALNFEIALNEKKLSSIRLSHPERKPKKETEILEVPAECFASLTSEEEAEIQRALSSNRRKVLVSHQTTNIDITNEILQCLKPKAWLNDEVINVYLELLKEREKREPLKYKKCHFFNTFFYKKLTNGGYNFKAVKRWTTEKKLGYFLIDCEKIFIPIHKQIHWCLAIININEKKFQYLDSLGGKDVFVLENLAKYFVDEVKEKSGKNIDVSGWERECPNGLPEQENGYDCGMFMIKYADFGSRGLDFSFSQIDMPYFRLRTAKEILRLRAE